MRVVFALAVGLLMIGCSNESQTTEKIMEKYAIDNHSFSEPNKVAVKHLSLDISVDFNLKKITGVAQYSLERNSGNLVILDVSGIFVSNVSDKEGNKLNFEIEDGNEMGDALHIDLNEGTEFIRIAYSTSPNASALLWLNPEQTLGKTAPFLFTQGQAILTRSWIPVQDSPSLRLTYDATVRTPDGLLAVMSATNPTETNSENTYSFTMDQPIPPYLMALAVGDLAFAPLGERSGVYAEPAMLDKSAYEFADVEKMLTAAEDLYGAYSWERYDILVLPPSFPFGGMENPRLTFATPTIIAGDRSLTSLIAHELAHSWSGNLVTNATWDDFWLNEGFTVYFEKRIMESIYGRDYAEMLNELGQQDLMLTIHELGDNSPDTELKLNLDGRNPDDGMTDIAYEKGYLFLRSLEELVGRERFDNFLKDYFSKNAFQTMTTERFIDYLEDNLLTELSERPDIEAWIYQPGLPENHPVPSSPLFDKVDEARTSWENGNKTLSELNTAEWSTHEWLHFIRGQEKSLGITKMTELDKEFNFTDSGNSEVAAAWFGLAIENDYRVAFPKIEDFLIRVGRRKFLKPLYEALSKSEENLKWAKQVYTKARPNYHAVSTETIDEILNYSPTSSTAM